MLRFFAFLALLIVGAVGQDIDGDGWTAAQGDCCETTLQCQAPAKVNPGAFDFVGNNLDDNCDGVVDNPEPACDTLGNQMGPTPLNLAKSLGICSTYNSGTGAGYGFVSGGVYLAEGTAAASTLGYSTWTNYGGGDNTPRAGSSQVIISSGDAKPSTNAHVNHGTTSSAPLTYLNQHGGQLSTKGSCPSGGSVANDPVRIRLTLKAPTNAQSFAFDFRFFSIEYPSYVCTSFNDFFLVQLFASPNPDIPADKQISFDSQGNPVSINNGFFTSCTTPVYGNTCPDGGGDLVGTLFAGHGATSWLTTTAPIKGGETFNIDFTVFDAGDHAYDSTVLIDNFRWSIKASGVVTNPTTGTTGSTGTTGTTGTTGFVAPTKDPSTPPCENPNIAFGTYPSQFTSFVFGDYKGLNSDVEGRLGAGGNVDLKNFAVGCQIYNTNPQTTCINFGSVTCAAIDAAGALKDSLVGGNDITTQNTQVYAGDVIYGNAFNKGPGTNIVADCSATKDQRDFGYWQQYLQSLSGNLATLSSTGTVQNNFGSLNLVGTKNPTLEVFSLAGADISTSNGFTVSNVDLGASIVINVDGTAVSIKNQGFNGNYPYNHVLFNFFQATSLDIKNVGIKGSILAPYADIVNPTGQIKGQTFAKSWTYSADFQGATLQQNYPPFEGCLPPFNPPPPPPPVNCLNPLGNIPTLFNTFVKNDFVCANSDTEGRLGAGKDIVVSNYAVACQLVNHEINTPCIQFGSVTCADLAAQGVYPHSLVSGTDLQWTNGQVFAGDVVYGGSEVPTGSEAVVVSDCSKSQGNPIDFDFWFDHLNGVSECLASRATTGSNSLVYSTLTFVGSGADIEVFDVDGSVFAAAKAFEISGLKNSATVIFNVHGKELALGGFQFPNYPFQRAIFNFPEATALTVYDVAWMGTILAPKASIINPTGVIFGSTYANEWISDGQNGNCAQQNYFPFQGCLPVCGFGDIPPPVYPPPSGEPEIPSRRRV